MVLVTADCTSENTINGVRRAGNAGIVTIHSHWVEVVSILVCVEAWD